MKYAIIGLTLFFVTPPTLLMLWVLSPSTFTLKNESGHIIRSVSVEVGGKTLHYEDISEGGEVSGSFRYQNEESFLVRGRFADGTEFEDTCGYLLWQDFQSRRTIIVRSDGMVNSRDTDR